ncbi:MAG: hypothetical protein R2748_33700 [Bryobacterales bacterium]
MPVALSVVPMSDGALAWVTMIEETNDPPLAHRRLTGKLIARLLAATGFPQAVGHDADQRRDQDEPVDGSHENER